MTFDEAEGTGDTADATTCCNTPTYPNVTSASSIVPGPGGGRVGAVLVSPFIKPGSTTDTPYNHFAMLCSVEDIFGVKHLGYAAQDGLQCFGKTSTQTRGVEQHQEAVVARGVHPARALVDGLVRTGWGEHAPVPPPRGVSTQRAR